MSIIPKKIRASQTFINGTGYPGKVDEITLPKLTRKMEDFQADHMDRPLKIDQGGEGLESSFVFGEYLVEAMREYGICSHEGTRIRVLASAEGVNCDFDEIEVLMQGRWSEIDFGKLKRGEANTLTAKLEINTFEYKVNGVELVFIDVEMGIERIGGVDRTLKRRQAIGLEY